MVKPTIITDPLTTTTQQTTTKTTSFTITTKSTAITTSKTTPAPTPPTPKPAPLDTIYYANDSNTVCLLFSVKIKFELGNTYQVYVFHKFSLNVFF